MFIIFSEKAFRLKCILVFMSAQPVGMVRISSIKLHMSCFVSKLIYSTNE